MRWDSDYKYTMRRVIASQIPLSTDLWAVEPPRAISSDEWKWLLGIAGSMMPPSLLQEHLIQWEYKDFVWTPPPRLLEPSSSPGLGNSEQREWLLKSACDGNPPPSLINRWYEQDVRNSMKLRDSKL